MKRFLVLIVVFLMLFSSVLSVFSADIGQALTNGTVYDYIADVIPLYLLSSGQTVNLDSIYTTQGYPVLNLDNTSYIYFIFENNTYFGRLIVDQINGKYYSSFMLDENETIQSLVVNQTPFLLLMPAEETLFIVWNGGYEVISDAYGSDIDIHILFDSIDTGNDFIALQPCLTQIEPTAIAQPNIDTSNYSISLDIPYVENDTSDDGKGLCWAASIASISKFRQGTNWTAYSLYSALESYYMMSPTGIMTWYKRAFNYLDMTYASASGAPTWQTIYNALNTSRPVMLGVKRTQSGTSYGHAIVCQSFIGGDGYAVLGFMDPNHSNTQYVTFSDATLNMSNFVYVSESRTYPTIIDYIY